MKAVLVWLALGLPGFAGEIAVGDLQTLPATDVVVVGEIHDNPVHHQNQALAVAAISPAALVFEMLTPEQAGRVTPANRADPGLGALLGWEAAGWPDFTMYQPIFTAAPRAAVYGAAVDLQGLRDIDSVVALLPDLRFGLGVALPPADQAAREAEQMAAHCDALPADLLPYMVAVQRLRDANLAAKALDALAQTGGPVVVIAGSGHARRDQGVPATLALAAPDVRVLTIGQVEDDPGAQAPYDLWLIAPPVPRDDPCAVFATGD